VDKLSERLELAAQILSDIGGQSALAATVREGAALARRVEGAPCAIMDKREFLSICAPTEEDFPALYALQGQRVRLVPDVGAGGEG
jgi:hypothetical protein